MATTLSNNISKWPIGVFKYNLGNIWETLSKNIGKFGEYDGYSTPIGYLANPYYNEERNDSFFKNDNAKKNSNNYLDYVKQVHNVNISNINNTLQTWRDIDNDRIITRTIDSLDTVIDNVSNTSLTVSDTDTLLGDFSTYYLGVSMRDSYTANSKKSRIKNGISSDINSYFGINEQSHENGNIFNRYIIDENTGRLNYYIHNTTSPIYNKYYQNIGTESGKWRNYYQLLSVTNNVTKSYLYGSIFGLDLVDELGLYSGVLNINALGTTLSIENYLSNNHSRYTLFNTYFDKIIGSFGSVSYFTDSNSNVIRYKLNDIGNYTLNSSTLYEYGESQLPDESDGGHSIREYKSNAGVAHGIYDTDISEYNNSDLISKTNTAFQNGQYRTLISRFYGNALDEKSASEINTAVDKWTNVYGISHGRNLLKKIPSTENTYVDPYCRVWTYHHQYHRLLDAIRPFSNANANGKTSIMTQRDLTGGESDSGSTYHWNLFSSRGNGNNFSIGRDRLDDYGVINKNNGLVNFAPIKNGKVSSFGLFEGDNKKDVDIKKCMFSIENLAWKGKIGHEGKYRLSDEQTGPLGGRIMWFPPYNMKINENSTANWISTDFIGRGEPIITYTNTNRRGSIQFSILIDHPSVVDYWRLSHKPENGNGEEDTINGDEQTLLRFFAGCDILIPQPFSLESKPIEKKKEDVVQPKKEETYKKIVFFVFFPNNYSGMDDYPNANARHTNINAIQYLLNGLGTQMMINTSLSQNLVDIPTDISTVYKYNNQTVGGYETRIGNNGISIVDGYDKLTGKTIYNGSVSKGKANTQGKIIINNIGPSNITLASRYVSPNNFNGNSNWCYRVDNHWCGQYFNLNKNNYLDRNSHGLNSYQGLSTVKSTAEKLGWIKKNDDNIILVSLADMYCAVDSTAMSNALKDLYNTDNVNAIKNVLNDTKNIKDIKVYGYASIQGYGEKSKLGYWRDKTNGNTILKYSNNLTPNEVLANDRATTVKNWINDVIKGLDKKAVVENTNQNTVKGSSTDKKTTIDNTGRITGNVDNLSYDKFYRCARVEISYSDTEEPISAKETVSNGINQIASTNMSSLGSSIFVSKKYGTCHVPNSVLSSLTSLKDNTEIQDNYIMNNSSWIDDSKMKKQAIIDKNNSQTNNNKPKPVDYETGKNNFLMRYDMESLFFNEVKTEDPFLYSQISQKIKYFDPAFHSITPEGFNARLTFLNQCMRQGHTISANENGKDTGNANNMSFGRPPICVLRIGDFYNTKIAIESMNIDYESWDLNIEGIGVQPMIANVNLSFMFLGGSDLAGPISRLQNALSFNYYANTGVYDNRSEMIEYNSDGTPKYFKGMDYLDNSNNNAK